MALYPGRPGDPVTELQNDINVIQISSVVLALPVKHNIKKGPKKYEN